MPHYAQPGLPNEDRLHTLTVTCATSASPCVCSDSPRAQWQWLSRSVCVQGKKEGNELIPEHRPLMVQGHPAFNITHQHGIQQRYQKHLLLKNMESIQRRTPVKLVLTLEVSSFYMPCQGMVFAWYFTIPWASSIHFQVLIRSPLLCPIMTLVNGNIPAHAGRGSLLLSLMIEK